MGTYHRQIGHANLLFPTLFDKADPLNAAFIAGKSPADIA